jgi:hypothetical protein
MVSVVKYDREQKQEKVANSDPPTVAEGRIRIRTFFKSEFIPFHYVHGKS